MLLATLGAAVGLVFARWTAPLLVRQIASPGSVVDLTTATDWRIVSFTVAVAALTAVVFGMAPAFSGSRVAAHDALKAQGRSVAGDGRFSTRNTLVVAQLALSLVLVIGVALFAQTFARLATLDVGFNPAPLMVVSVTAPSTEDTPEERLALFDRLRNVATQLPGVTGASVSMLTPVSGSAWNSEIEIPGQVLPKTPGSLPMVNYVVPGWFSTYGTPMLRGRDFTDTDRKGAPLVVVVNDAFTRRFFPDREAIGQTIVEPAFRSIDERKIYQVVGVVHDAVYRRLREPVPPTMYFPLAQIGDGLVRSAAITIRAGSDRPSALTKSVADAFTQVNSTLSLTFRPLSERISDSLAQERLVAIVSGFFGVLALLLASLGLYGVTAFSVSRRRREIGVRLALGARPSGIVGLVLRRVVWMVSLGIVGGALISIWASTFVASLLFGVTAHDPVVFVAAAGVLGAVSLVAGWLPARRAARLDPSGILRDA
jgi:predicted permease